jgi:hypothetical protein
MLGETIKCRTIGLKTGSQGVGITEKKGKEEVKRLENTEQKTGESWKENWRGGTGSI